MRKTEFMDLLKYYFRNEDKGDLKGIIEDCNEQFRLGAKEGKTEEEVCAKLGHPKNIYRYYIGKPIVPEDNESLKEATVMPDFDEPQPPQPQTYTRAAEDIQQQPYGNRPYTPPQQPIDRETGKDFDWNDGDSSVPQAAKAVASPFLDILGTLFSMVSGFLYLGVALAILACIGISALPAYLYTGLLPLPTLSLTTMIFAVLTILFAALTATYAGEACHDAARRTSTSKRRRA